jgi:hypothetical protein
MSAWPRPSCRSAPRSLIRSSCSEDLTTGSTALNARPSAAAAGCGQRPGHADALLLPAGQLVRVAARQPGQAALFTGVGKQRGSSAACGTPAARSGSRITSRSSACDSAGGVTTGDRPRAARDAPEKAERGGSPMNQLHVVTRYEALPYVDVPNSAHAA